MKIVSINKEPVELYKILKFEGLLESGGAAKNAIAQGLVEVNDCIEKRKRKKIIAGDTIVFNGEKLYVNLL
ncbi:MAG: RNA-binding S4 domain-containing protein [Cellvibrionales bacterium]|jgi:ribosome-associated protein|nr:RNA-binding S4 domain-containing protein [Cellvibrionales bacterium]MBT7438159.1 RNA-binding S4 domain-containing protein [Cellvibrionales bacterium]MDC1270639.1 RNA-binding S4 domain-containing protein [Porticoccus sp.]